MSAVPLPRSLVWEVTPRCDLRCGHCYNVWKASGTQAPAELGTAEMLEVLASIASGCARTLQALTLSGGEPLLRDDLVPLVAAARRALPRAQLSLATNGQRLGLEGAQALRSAGLEVAQLTLLSAQPEVHDAMVGKPGAFESTLAAISSAKRAGLTVAVFFVATRQNVDGFAGAAKLALAVGADAIVFNRFQPGGSGLLGWRERTPTPAQLAAAQQEVERVRSLADVSLGTVLPPCEVPGQSGVMSCPIGTVNAYPTVGPDGTLRPCNHTQQTAGSLFASDLSLLLQQPCMAPPLVADLPSECAGCPWERSCRGGCRAARCLAGEPIYACAGCR